MYKYDILDQPIETVQEVSNGANPQFLDTLTRYDPNGNVVLTIEPEGNATAMVYDERNLVYQTIQGATAPPPLALLAASDPHNYDVRGGLPATTTDDYDPNGNLIQSVAADDTDGSLANNSQLPSGTSTGGNTATTLVDTHQDWMPNQWAGTDGAHRQRHRGRSASHHRVQLGRSARGDHRLDDDPRRHLGLCFPGGPHPLRLRRLRPPDQRDRRRGQPDRLPVRPRGRRRAHAPLRARGRSQPHHRRPEYAAGAGLARSASSRPPTW